MGCVPFHSSSMFRNNTISFGRQLHEFFFGSLPWHLRVHLHQLEVDPEHQFHYKGNISDGDEISPIASIPPSGEIMKQATSMESQASSDSGEVKLEDGADGELKTLATGEAELEKARSESTGESTTTGGITTSC
ncbi:uncharacterized protein LOC109836482 [Asparagus officinalis]|uniref:uncharacterized protein LOC109836482 n=1 Tax=Asparagus officinalis TaxID=4686 RepID=UPI00098E5FA6|nr:uncharacterized protein LOC109836482 [Asparagus officinalis]